MNLHKFVAEHEMSAAVVPSAHCVNKAEELLGITFGEQTREYLLTYGRLSTEQLRFMGIDRVDKLRSDMVTETLAVHMRFPETSGYAVIAMGNNTVNLVDQNDMVSIFHIDTGKFEETGLDLGDFIISFVRLLEG